MDFVHVKHAVLFFFIAVLLKPLLGISNSTFLGCVEESNISRCFTVYHEGETDRGNASRACRARDSYLASINNQEVSSLVNSSLTGKAWISLMLSQDVNMSYEWRSVIESVTTDDHLLATLANSSFLSCLTFVSNRGFAAEPCTAKYGFFCSSALDPNNTYGGCVENGTCYIMVNSTAASWYGARSYCRIHHDGDLLAPQINISDAINRTAKRLGSATIKIWMGASNAMWNWQHRDDASVGEMFFSNWAPSHPAYNNDCAVVNLMDGLWMSVSCTDGTYAYVCESVTLMTTATSTPSTAAPSMDSTANGHPLLTFMTTETQTPSTAVPAMDSTVNGHQLPIVSTVAPTMDLTINGQEWLTLSTVAPGMTSKDNGYPWWFYFAVIFGCLVVIIIVAIIICATVTRRKRTMRNEAAGDSASTTGYTTSPIVATGLPLTRSPYEDVPDFTSNEMQSVAMMTANGGSVIHNPYMNGTRTSSIDEIPMNGIRYKISKDGDLYALPVKVSSNGLQSEQSSNESEEEKGETGIQLFDQDLSHNKESQERGKEGADCEGRDMKDDVLSEKREDRVSGEEDQDIYKEGQDIAKGEKDCDTSAPEIKGESPESTRYNRDSNIESEVDSQRSQQSDDDEQESEKGNLEENDGVGHYSGGLRNI